MQDLIYIIPLERISRALTGNELCRNGDVDLGALLGFYLLENFHRSLYEGLFGNGRCCERRNVICRIGSIVDTADHDIIRDLVAALYEFIGKSDCFVVIGTYYGFGKSAVFFDEEVSHLRPLIDPVIPVEDHFLADLQTGLVHRIFKSCTSLSRIDQIIPSGNKSYVVSLALGDNILGDFMHQVPVIGNYIVESRYLRSDADDRWRILIIYELFHQFLGHTFMNESVVAEDYAVVFVDRRER